MLEELCFYTQPEYKTVLQGYTGKSVFNLHASVGIGVYKSGQGDFNSLTCKY